MIDPSIIISTIPPMLSALFAYILGRKKNNVTEKVNRAKIESEIQIKALNIVENIVNDMREEMRKDISFLKDENKSLKDKILGNEEDIRDLECELKTKEQLTNILNKEVNSLKNTTETYEHEISRLKGK